MNPGCSTSDEGVAKFTPRWSGTAPLPESDWRDLSRWREKLVAWHVLGVDTNGVAFGNLSQRRTGTCRFIITGTQTAGLPSLDERHFVEVESFDLERHALECRGPMLPSSEALSHAAVYASDPRVMACFHVHHPRLWRELFDRVPTTSSDGECGSLKITHDILQLFADARGHEPRIIVMGGHPDGLLFAGETLEDAGRRLSEELRRI